MELEFQAITPRKISDEVYNQLKTMILNGKFPPGSKLPSTRELCELFNVGRSAIRDALSSLKGMGLISIKQGEGIFVNSYNPSLIFHRISLINSQDVIKLYQVRKMLEVEAAGLASINRTSDQLEKMTNAISQMENPSNETMVWQSDYQFHMAVSNATGNQFLHQLMISISESMKKAIFEVHHFIFSDQKVAKEMVCQHVRIYEAIKNGDASKAKETMRHHLLEVESIIYEHLGIDSNF
ncbi:FadR family transcriptional regulator [Microaerobacter geothermalis]|uniref:FadR/GntR family transcriptional regulator n=1 Tax=Microaerobacter geothermalis TaxID=674972 RepID=UPI001F1F33D4|nr:FadR/GntR family transcriptional regulator [Microaerobacter geothermalis]MCF6092848.1 FadR family transcriptional regulator [Microaerobacter geothermalis]